MSRNETARSRRRQMLKQEQSLRSLPLEVQTARYSLDNHFGWKVLQKCRIGDGSFPPYLLHCVYCDKPDVPGGGGEDKVMYVLYIRGQDGDIAAKDAKETQTVVVTQKEPPRKEPKPKEKMKRKSVERKKVVSDFYYIPIKERVMARYDIRPAEGDGEGATPTLTRSKGPAPKKGRGRKKPKSWTLRAGAEQPEGEDSTDTDGDLEDEEEAEVTEEDSGKIDLKDDEEVKSTHSSRKSEVDDKEEVVKTTHNSRKCKVCIDCFSVCSHVELMSQQRVTSGVENNNRYLYMPKDRYEKRPLKQRNPGSHE